MWYSFVLIVFAVLSIMTPLGNGYIKKHPWNFNENSSGISKELDA